MGFFASLVPGARRALQEPQLPERGDGVGPAGRGTAWDLRAKEKGEDAAAVPIRLQAEKRTIKALLLSCSTLTLPSALSHISYAIEPSWVLRGFVV